MKSILANCTIRWMSIISRHGLVHNRLDALLNRIIQIPSVDKGTQILLQLKYRELLQRELPLPTFEDVEFRAFSQNGEDGILLYIFTLIGMMNRRAVEICAGDGIECNTANLIINHGWTALLFDGNSQLIERGKAFYTRKYGSASNIACPMSLISSG